MGITVPIEDEVLRQIYQDVVVNKISTYQAEGNKLGIERSALGKRVKRLCEPDSQSQKTKTEKTTKEKNVEPKENLIETGQACPEKEKEITDKITFTLPLHLVRALRLKAVYTDKKPVDVLKESLYNSIEPIYFKDAEGK